MSTKYGKIKIDEHNNRFDVYVVGPADFETCIVSVDTRGVTPEITTHENRLSSVFIGRDNAEDFDFSLLTERDAPYGISNVWLDGPEEGGFVPCINDRGDVVVSRPDTIRHIVPQITMTVYEPLFLNEHNYPRYIELSRGVNSERVFRVVDREIISFKRNKCRIKVMPVSCESGYYTKAKSVIEDLKNNFLFKD